MKRTFWLFSIVATVSIGGLMMPTALLAGGTHVRVGYSVGFGIGFHGGQVGVGYHHRPWGRCDYGRWGRSGWWIPLGVSLAYSGAPRYYRPVYYDPPAPVSYPSSPVAYDVQPPPPPEPFRGSGGENSGRVPEPALPNPPTDASRPTPASMSVADVKALVKARVSDEVIMRQIRQTRSIFHLTTADILELKRIGGSETVINFMIDTPSFQLPK